ncbi:hypothetical protein DV735_g1281, partial [Chaetothyriales sp. CBS 134920]
MPNLTKSLMTEAQKQTWTLVGMQMPPVAVMEAMINAYFDRFHWFILLFHPPSFLRQARLIISRSSWPRHELGTVLTTLMVAALGLQCTAHDPAWQGRDKLARACLDPLKLVADILSEVSRHLIQVLEDCEIETIQVYTLLAVYHISHGSPNLAFAYSGVALRIGHGLSLQSNRPSNATVVSEVAKRCWNHLMAAETFSSMIYGRSIPYAQDFTSPHHILDMDDMMLESGLAPGCSSLTWATFHRLKNRIYTCLQDSLRSFSQLHRQAPISPEYSERLAKVVRWAKLSLEEWRQTLPPFFDYHKWPNEDPESQFKNGTTTLSREQQVLCLQATTLQIIYDSAVIFVNRPLLEHRIHAPESEGGENEETFTVLHESVSAALRISRVPILKFEHEMALSFLLVHSFAAGVILCLPPTCYPFSQMAQDAKSGVLNIVRASKSLMHRSAIAKSSQEILTNLLKVTLDREIDIASDISQTNERLYMMPLDMTSTLLATQPRFRPDAEAESDIIHSEDVPPHFSTETQWYWPSAGDMPDYGFGIQPSRPMDPLSQAMFVGPDMAFRDMSAF